MQTAKLLAQNLIDFLYENPTPYHVVEGGIELLQGKGFSELVMGDQWNVKPGGKYYVTRNGSALIAFIAGTGNPAEAGFRMVGAHTDAPALRVKAKPEIIAEKAYLKLNIEIYGGPIYSTWLDRPLSIAGRLTLRSSDPLKPEIKLIDIRKPIAIVPNMAIHINREINTGYQYNPQKDLLPLIGLGNEHDYAADWFLDLLADRGSVAAEDILGFDLFLYDYQKGTLNGINEEFISVGRLDDVAMSYTALRAIVASKAQEATIIAACFDNEEVGSRTKQGAGSTFLPTILERVVLGLGGTIEDYHRARYNSFAVSCDMAHAVHPNAGDKHDPTHRPIMNQGPVIKVHHAQKYSSDADSVAAFKQVCEAAGAPYQMFHNRNDARSGGTIGNIIATLLDMRSVDIGNPMLAMHSLRELCGVMDVHYLLEIFKKFYEV